MVVELDTIGAQLRIPRLGSGRSVTLDGVIVAIHRTSHPLRYHTMRSIYELVDRCRDKAMHSKDMRRYFGFITIAGCFLSITHAQSR